MKRKIFSILLILVLLLSFSLVAATMVAAQTSDADIEAASLTATDRLVATQNNDGGWEWENPDTDPEDTNNSPANTLGVTAQGILDIYRIKKDTAYLAACIAAYDAMVTNASAADPYRRRIRSTDISFLVELSEVTGNDAYANFAKERYEAAVTEFGGGTATGFAEYIRDLRIGQGWQALVAWDIDLYVQGALALHRYFSEGGYDAHGVAMAEVIYKWLYVDDPGFNFGDTEMDEYWLTYTGAIEAFATTGTHATEVEALVDKLLKSQETDGHFVGIGAGWDTQTTAYAVMALLKVGETAAARAGAEYLEGAQFGNGGIGDEVENTEVTSEMTQAIFDLLQVTGKVSLDRGSDGDVDVKTLTIQFAIDAAKAGDTINVAKGTYNEDVAINKSELWVKSTAANHGAVINGRININADNVTFEGFEVVASGYEHLINIGDGVSGTEIIGNKVSAEYIEGKATSAIGNHCNHRIDDVTVTGNIVIRAVGFYVAPGAKVVIENNTIDMAGDEGIWLYDEAGDVTIVGNTILNYNLRNAVDAKALAINHRPTSVNEKTTSGKMLDAIKTDNPGIDSVDLKWAMVQDGESIQEAIDASLSGDTIWVAAGTYVEAVTIGKSLTLRGATSNVNKNGYPVPAGYAWDETVESIITHPDPSGGYIAIVDIVDTDNVTFEGFVVQELNAEGNNNSSLIRVRAQAQKVSNVVVRNNIIGPNTNVTSQDGTHGRMGLYLVNNPYSDQYGIVNSTFSGNKIFDCKGNGNNIFIWSSYSNPAYGAPGPAPMNGTVIEDNEIYGAHRSGIETAGGYTGLTIRNNKIYGNGGSVIEGKPELMFGNGIVLIRGSSDSHLEDNPGLGPENLTIKDNEIYDNEKNGIYMGPVNKEYTITGNKIYHNGWDGIRLDLYAAYHNPDFEEGSRVPWGDQCSDIVAQFNNIYDNDGYGIRVMGTPTNSFVFIATYNWWGAVNGPDDSEGAIGGSGDEISGNVDADDWIQFVLEPDFAPVATLINAPTGLTNATSYTVTVDGIGVVSYSYRLDDGTWSGELDVDDPLEFEVDADGKHTLYVVGKGAEDWQAEADATTATWTVDTTPPVATIKNKPRGISIKIIIGGTDVKFYKYWIDEGALSVAYPVKVPIRESVPEAGDHALYVIGIDSAGNVQSEEEATYAEWSIVPSVPTAVLSNLPDIITRETSASITVGGEDVDRYKYSIDGGSWISGGVTETIDLSDLDEGAHTIYVNAYNIDYNIWQDEDSGESTDSATVFTWTVDSIPPDAITTLTAASGTPASTVIKLSWPAVEDGLRGYRLWYSKSEINGEDLDAATELFTHITPGPVGHAEAFTVKGLSQGTEYFFAVSSVDAAGNVSGISNVASQKTATTLPTITSLGLTGGGNTGNNGEARELRITGTHFSIVGNNIVRFIGSGAAFDISSKADSSGPSEIFADVPEGAPVGAYRVRVINGKGTSNLSRQTYTITSAPAPLPQVKAVLPGIGAIGKTITIKIKGSNFRGATEVSFVRADGVSFTPLSFTASDTLITAEVTLPATEGRYDVQVHTPRGSNAGSGVKFEVYEPVDLGTAAGSTTTTEGVDMPDDGIVPVQVTLATDDREEVAQVSASEMEIEVTIDPGTEITLADGTPYTETIDPPRQVPVTEDIVAELDDPNAVVFTMGSATERLELGEDQTMFVTLDITMPSDLPAPLVYYLEADGSLSIAGIDGEYGDLEIEQGGTVLATQFDVPEEGFTTYTLGLLLDHMSTFVAGTQGAPATSIIYYIAGRRGGGGCFIATAAYGSLMEPHVKILREFRDRFLHTNTMGKALVGLYYTYSPPLAEFIAKHDALRASVRWGLLPFVGLSWMALHLGLWLSVAIMTFLLVLMCAAAGITLRRRVRLKN